MMKRLDKEAYDRAQRGYVAPATLAPPGLEAHGAAQPALAKLKEQLMAKLARGQEVVQRKLATPLKERLKGRSEEKPTATAKTPTQASRSKSKSRSPEDLRDIRKSKPRISKNTKSPTTGSNSQRKGSKKKK